MKKGNSDLIDIEVVLQHETERAILVSADENSTKVWIPKSQVEFETKAQSRIIELTMPQWLAEDKGLV